MTVKPHIKDWLYDNAEYIKTIVDEAKEIQVTNLQIYPLFFDEINSDFNNFCRAKIAIEASTAIGCSTEEVAIAIEEIGLEHFK
jgi:hypothetical protein